MIFGSSQLKVGPVHKRLGIVAESLKIQAVIFVESLEYQNIMYTSEPLASFCFACKRIFSKGEISYLNFIGG